MDLYIIIFFILDIFPITSLNDILTHLNMTKTYPSLMMGLWPTMNVHHIFMGLYHVKEHIIYSNLLYESKYIMFDRVFDHKTDHILRLTSFLTAFLPCTVPTRWINANHPRLTSTMFYHGRGCAPARQEKPFHNYLYHKLNFFQLFSLFF